MPAGGLSLWVELDAPRSTALAAIADRYGLRLAAGPRFGVDGAFERFLRLPYSLPEPVLEEAAARLAVAWRAVTRAGAAGRRAGSRARRLRPSRANICSCMLAAMEPAVHRITILAPQPPAVWQRLETVLADGGSPPIAMTRSATTITFTCDTGDFMLRARVADALMTVCDHGEWRRCFAPED